MGPPLSYRRDACTGRPARRRKDGMRLTLQTDYALRVLMYVAAKGESLSTIAEIVDRFDISRGHIMKVVHRLSRKGYLETIRGNRGGMRLARDAARIGVGAVVRDMEEEL